MHKLLRELNICLTKNMYSEHEYAIFVLFFWLSFLVRVVILAFLT